jgi:hypothetical protein
VNALGVHQVHCDDGELAASVLGQSLQLAGGLRISACCATSKLWPAMY